MLEQFYEQNKIEVGIDEAGRGCLFGPVCVAAVIWLDEDPIQDDKNYEIKDSKKVSEKKRTLLKDYIKDNSIAYNIQLIHHDDIDKYNILQATLRGMHLCLNNITDIINVDTILIDGNHFDFYSDKNDKYIDHV